MSNLAVITQNELKDPQTAIELYKSRWFDILIEEWGVKDAALLDKILEQQQQARSKLFPEGQKAAIDPETGTLGGTINSIIFSSSHLCDITTWDQLTGKGYGSTHNLYGPGDSLICYAVQSDPEVKGAFRALVSAQKDLAINLGLEQLFVFTRPNGFRDYAQQHSLPIEDPTSLEKYLGMVTQKGLVVPNDGVSAHTHIGAKLSPLLMGGKPYLPGSRPADSDSAGHNVLMEYSLQLTR